MELEVFFDSLKCSGENCLSWILLAFNGLTIFMLVFNSKFKPNGFFRFLFFIWLCLGVVGIVFSLVVHPCVNTVLMSILTTIIILLSYPVAVDKSIYDKDQVLVDQVIIENNGSLGYGSLSNIEPTGDGIYKIHHLDENEFVYVLYGPNNKPIGYSLYKYENEILTRDRIELTRNRGMIANIEDNTGNKETYLNHPKFVVYRVDRTSYQFKLMENDADCLLISIVFDNYRDLVDGIDFCRKAIGTPNIIDSTEPIKNRYFESYKDIIHRFNRDLYDERSKLN